MFDWEWFGNFLRLENPWMVGIFLNSILIVFALIAPKKLLTPWGLVHGWILGVLIWGCLGWPGYTVVMFYFLVGSGVTRIKMKEKEALGIAEKRQGARGPENVWGSALTGTICALGLAFLQAGWLSDSGLFYLGLNLHLTDLFLLGYVSSFSTKLSDTCASEIGKAYGKNTFLITTLKSVPKGTEGAVSWEGTVAGVLASLLISGVAYGVGMIDLWGIIWCILAALIATNLESVIGATIQNQFDWLTNELVNIINTTIGAIVAILLAVVWSFLPLNLSFDFTFLMK